MARTSLAPSPLLAPLPPLQTQSKKLIFIVSQCKTTCQNNHVSADLIFLTISVVLCKTKPQFPPLSDNSLTVLSSVTRQHVGTALSPALATPDCSVNNNNPEPPFPGFFYIFIHIYPLWKWTYDFIGFSHSWPLEYGSEGFLNAIKMYDKNGGRF